MRARGTTDYDQMDEIIDQLTTIRNQIDQINQARSLQLLTVDEVAELLKVTPKHIYAMIKEQKFPAQIKLGNASRWRQSDIELWLSSTNRDSNAAGHNDSSQPS